MRSAFDYDLERYLAFGGYPGAVTFEADPDRWYDYMKDAIVEAVIGKDILHNHRITKPALFRQAFEIFTITQRRRLATPSCLASLGQGNTDLIKHYIELYSNAFLLHTLQKYSPKAWLVGVLVQNVASLSSTMQQLLVYRGSWVTSSADGV